MCRFCHRGIQGNAVGEGSADPDRSFIQFGQELCPQKLEGVEHDPLAHRAYLLRAGVLTQLSDDQTLVAQMVREGKLTPEQAQSSPISNVILEALGAKEAISPIVWADPLALSDGDILVLCSDGLSGVVADATIAGHIARLPPDEACGALIEAAKAAGAPDNVSVGVFRVAAGVELQQRDQAEPPSGTTRQLKVPREGSTTAELRPPVS